METQAISNTPRRLNFDEEPHCATLEAANTTTPKIGMEFESDELAFEFYNNYGRLKGFSVRKEWVNHSLVTGGVTSRKLTCSKQGFRQTKPNISVKNPHRDTRTGCLAHMTISLQPNNHYAVIKFEEEHNHALVTPSKTHLIRSQRKINVAQSVEVDLAAKSGLNPKETYEFMSRLAGGRENLGFIPVDLQNYLSSKRQHDMELGDAWSILLYFRKKQTESPSFYYSVQLDSSEQITNIFWCDAKMRLDYERFGDVVSFDTTYKVHKYGRPFAPFVGVNNHKRTVVFGAALMYDETKESFIWVYETFLQVMYGKEPKTILTDQDHAMRSAISYVFKETKHRLCVWHLHQNALKNLKHVYKRFSSFAHDFNNCIYDFEEEEEFVKAWEIMLEKYDLKENEWLQGNYKEREKWALVYDRRTFCADMKSTQLSESFNATLKRYLNSKIDVLRFFEHFERILDDVRHKELVSNYDMTQKIPRLKVDAILLRHARDVYTAKVFEWFQKEFELATNLVINNSVENGAITVYKIGMYGKNREHVVTVNFLDDTISCSCLKYDFVGILCCHILKVFDRNDVKIIPSKYIMKRWTKDATLKVGSSYEKLEKKLRTTKNSKLTSEIDLSQPVCDEERNLIQAKGLKVRQGGVRGGRRPKSCLESGYKKRRKNKNVRISEYCTVNAATQECTSMCPVEHTVSQVTNNVNYELALSRSSMYHQSNAAILSQGSSMFMYPHPSNMPTNAYNMHTSYTQLLQAASQNSNRDEIVRGDRVSPLSQDKF